MLLESNMTIRARVEVLERFFGTGVPRKTDKMPLEVFRRFVDGTNSPAEFNRWAPLLREIADAAMSAMTDLDPEIASDNGK